MTASLFLLPSRTVKLTSSPRPFLLLLLALFASRISDQPSSSSKRPFSRLPFMSSAVLLRAAARSRNPPLLGFARSSSSTTPLLGPAWSAARKIWSQESSGLTSQPSRSPPLPCSLAFAHPFTTSARTLSGPHDEETFEEFTARYGSVFSRLIDIHQGRRSERSRG